MSQLREKSAPHSAEQPSRQTRPTAEALAGPASAPGDEAPTGFALLAEVNAPAFEIMRELNARALVQWTEAHAVWLRFMQRRITRDMELPSRLAQCKSPLDVVRVYAEFFQTAAQDYQQEIADVTRLGQSFGNAAASVVREKAETVEKRLSLH